MNKVGITFLDELTFSTERINVNFSNYSSWHYRSTLFKKIADEHLITKEIKLVESAIFTDPADSSAWFYLRWILSNTNVKDEQKLLLLKEFEELANMEPDCKCEDNNLQHKIGFLVNQSKHYYLLGVLMAKCWLTSLSSLEDRNVVNRQIESYESLRKLDPMRRGRYNYCLNQTKIENGPNIIEIQ